MTCTMINISCFPEQELNIFSKEALTTRGAVNAQTQMKMANVFEKQQAMVPAIP